MTHREKLHQLEADHAGLRETAADLAYFLGKAVGILETPGDQQNETARKEILAEILAFIDAIKKEKGDLFPPPLIASLPHVVIVETEDSLQVYEFDPTEYKEAHLFATKDALEKGKGGRPVRVQVAARVRVLGTQIESFWEEEKIQ